MEDLLRRIWKAIDAAATLQTVGEWVLLVKTKAATAMVGGVLWGLAGNIVLAVAVGFIFFLTLVAVEHFWKRRKGSHERIATPLQPENLNEYVFPYICKITAESLIRNGEGFIEATVSFPSALSKVDILLTGELIINGARTERLPSERVSLSKPAVYTISQWRAQVPLTLQRTIRDAVEGGRPLSVSAEIWSDADPSFHWNLEECTIHPLVGQTP